MRAILKLNLILEILKSEGASQRSLDSLMELYKTIYTEAYNDGQRDLREDLELDDE